MKKIFNIFIFVAVFGITGVVVYSLVNYYKFRDLAISLGMNVKDLKDFIKINKDFYRNEWIKRFKEWVKVKGSKSVIKNNSGTTVNNNYMPSVDFKDANFYTSISNDEKRLNDFALKSFKKYGLNVDFNNVSPILQDILDNLGVRVDSKEGVQIIKLLTK